MGVSYCDVGYVLVVYHQGSRRVREVGEDGRPPGVAPAVEIVPRREGGEDIAACCELGDGARGQVVEVGDGMGGFCGAVFCLVLRSSDFVGKGELCGTYLSSVGSRPRQAV